MPHSILLTLPIKGRVSVLSDTGRGERACIYLHGQPAALHPEQSTESTAGSAGLLWQECIRGVCSSLSLQLGWELHTPSLRMHWLYHASRERLCRKPLQNSRLTNGAITQQCQAVTAYYIIFLAINYHGKLLATNSVLGLIHYPEEQGIR